MLNGELPKAQKLALQAETFVKLSNADVQEGITYLMLRALPSGTHDKKLSALPEFIQATMTHLSGTPSEVFNETISDMLKRMPQTDNGDEIAAVEAITETAKFLGYQI